MGMKRFVIALMAMLLMLPAGCIIRDEVNTISIRPDGSADVVVFHSNIRSTQEGVEGEQALRTYAASFDAGELADLVRIDQAGGEVLDARWVRREAPRASLIKARLPSAEALEQYGSFDGDEGGMRAATRFEVDGALRRLTTEILLPADYEVPEASTRAPAQVQNDRANAISETRVVVVDGRIAAAQGWTVASDRRSALLSVDEVIEMVRENPERIELVLEWEITAP
jgi:hypothetical protein